MILPQKLEAWTLEVVERVASEGVAENDVFDLKADLPSAEAQRKIVAAFANSSGGFLVFGVRNDRVVVGVSNPELPRDFGNRLATHLEPSVEYRFGTPLRLPSGQAVLVCEVPKSRRAPHAVLVSGAWAFFKRGPGGSNEPMTYSEIRASFVEASRRRSYLLLLRNELDRISEYGRMLNINAWERPQTVLGTLDGGQFAPSQIETLLPEVFGDLAVDPSLLSALNLVRDRAAQLDTVLRSFSTRFEAARLTQDDVDEHLAVLRREPAQIHQAADRAAEALGRILQRG